MQKNEVKSLIESIKSQTEQLKNTVRNCVGIKKIATTSPSNEPSSSISKKPTYSRKKLNHEISEVLFRNPENSINVQQNSDYLREILEENEDLKIEIQGLKKSLIFAVNQCKAFKREFDDEKRKNLRLSILEAEYSKEKKKTSGLNEKNFELKKQMLNLMNKIKVFLANCEKDSLETIQENAKLLEENEAFREILNKSQIIEGNIEKSPIENPKNLKDLTEDYKKIKDLRKENKEKQRIEAKNKEKNANNFSYFQGNSQNEIISENGNANNQSIIDMYEEKIIQNSMKSGSGSLNTSLNINVNNNTKREKSPLISGTLRKK